MWLPTVWKSTSASGAPDNSSLSHFSAMTRPCWPRRAMRNRHRHAIEQASRRWRGGRRDDSARTRRKIFYAFTKHVGDDARNACDELRTAKGVLDHGPHGKKDQLMQLRSTLAEIEQQRDDLRRASPTKTDHGYCGRGGERRTTTRRGQGQRPEGFSAVGLDAGGSQVSTGRIRAPEHASWWCQRARTLYAAPAAFLRRRRRRRSGHRRRRLHGGSPPAV